MLLINVYHGYQILNTLADTGYDIHAACTFFADDTISIHDLNMQIHVGFELLPNHFNLTLVHEPTLPNQVRVFFYILFEIVFEKI
jgi:hypothetical protein